VLFGDARCFYFPPKIGHGERVVTPTEYYYGRGPNRLSSGDYYGDERKTRAVFVQRGGDVGNESERRAFIPPFNIKIKRSAEVVDYARRLYFNLKLNFVTSEIFIVN